MTKASLFGMPHVGCEYVGGSHKVLDGARCVVCGAVSENAHHVVPRSVRHTFFLRGHELRSPLWAMCGSGTRGCHGLVHSGRYGITWEWDDEESEARWWSGELLDLYGEHGPRLFLHGRYVLEDRDTGMRYDVRHSFE